MPLKKQQPVTLSIC